MRIQIPTNVRLHMQMKLGTCECTYVCSSTRAHAHLHTCANQCKFKHAHAGENCLNFVCVLHVQPKLRVARADCNCCLHVHHSKKNTSEQETGKRNGEALRDCLLCQWRFPPAAQILFAFFFARATYIVRNLICMCRR